MKIKSFCKGVGIGFIAGSVVAAAMIPMDKKRAARTKTGRCLRTVGEVVEGISDALCQ